MQSWLIALIGGGLVATQAPEATDPPGAAADDTIVITGTRTASRLADTPVETEVIDRARIEGSGARTVAEVLASAGLAVTEASFAGAGASLQGLSARQTLVLVDGERTTGQVDGVTDLSRVRVEHIERIEIVRGSASSVYGADAMGGVINIITRRGRSTTEAQVDLAGASDAAWDASGSASGALGPLKARLSAGHHVAPSFDLRPRGIGATGSAIDDSQAGSRFDLKLGNGVTLDAGGDWALRRRQGVISRETGAVLDRVQLDETFDARIGLRWKGSGGDTLRASLHGQTHRSQYDVDQRGATALDVYEDNRFRRADNHVAYTTTLLGWHRATVGFDGIYEDALTPRIGEERVSRLRGAVYVQDEWTIATEPYSVLVVGGRVDFDEWFGTQITPRVAGRYDPHPRVELRASVGLGYRAPDLKEMFLRFENPSVGYIVEGDPDLGPETALSSQLGVRWRFIDGLAVRVNLFNHLVDGLVTVVPLGMERYGYANVAEAVSQGVETELSANVGPFLQSTVGYTFTDARDRKTDLQLEGRVRHRAFLELTARQPRWRADLTVRGAIDGPRPLFVDEPALERMSDPIAVLTARSSVGIGETLRIYVRGENLLNMGDPDAAPLRPRRVGLGVIGRL